MNNILKNVCSAQKLHGAEHAGSMEQREMEERNSRYRCLKMKAAAAWALAVLLSLLSVFGGEVPYVNEIQIVCLLLLTGEPPTQAEVTNRLQKASRVTMLVSLAGEWGHSMRLSGTTRFPKNMTLGAIEDNSLITDFGKEVARQCKEMGIHIYFAPDMDVNSNTDNPVIGLRSFGENPEAVAD